MSNWLLFTNSQSSAAGTSDYVKDVFEDVTLEATNNTSLTDNSNTNPFGWNFNNTDTPTARSKTLFIKDLALMETGKWLNSKPTYEIIWDEEFPGVKGYLSGDFTFQPRFNGSVITLFASNTPNLVGVTGVFRRVAFLVQPLDATVSSMTATYYVDGSAGNSVEYGGPTSTIDRINGFAVGRPGQEVYLPLVHATSNLTKDLHDVQLRRGTNILPVYGVIVYFDDTSAGVDQRPGTSYIDKIKVTSSSGQTMALGGFTGTSIGGNYLVKKSTTGYSLIASGFSTIAVNGVGLSGTNTINVDVGFGGSFSTMDAIIASNGTSNYIGKITSISTDALTVSPTMTFGISGIITRAWQMNATLNINASLFIKTNTIDFTNTEYANLNVQRLWSLDPKGKYGAWANNVRQASLIVGSQEGGMAFMSAGASGFIHIEGYCAAMDVVFCAVGGGASPTYMNASFVVNGLPAYNVGQTLLSAQQYTVLSNGGNQWNTLQIYPGVSMSSEIVLQRINFYERDVNRSVSFGVLGSIVENSAYLTRPETSISLPALGLGGRIYSTQMYLTGGWELTGFTLINQAGGMRYIGASTNCVATIEYYGKDFCFNGQNGASMLLVVDGAAAVGASFGRMRSVASEGLHRLTLSHVSGTCIIDSFDYQKTHKDVTWEGNLLDKDELPGLLDNLTDVIKFVSNAGQGAVATAVRRYAICEIYKGNAMSAVQDSDQGLRILIQKSGLYIGYAYNGINTTSGITAAGISRNVQASALGSAINVLGVGQILAASAYESGATGSSVDEVVVSGSFVAYLNAGDVLRSQDIAGFGGPDNAAVSGICIARIK